MSTRAPAILLVEDNPDEAELTRLAFERAAISCAIHLAHDGEEALRYLFGGATEPHVDLVLLDLHMPGVDGFGVLSRLRQEARTRLVPAVMLSSSRAREDITRAYELGASSFVVKPTLFSAYLDTVGQLGRYWLETSESPRGDE